MAKSKKKKNADFQKIKLKVGKKLSKGDNVTNLSFKTRQIHLTQTIRTGDTSAPVTRRNLSIQDLLRQCVHHSVGARVNAIAGIKELMLNNFADFLVPSNVHGYAVIMKKISSMLIDNESDVRHSVINLFKLMFSKLKFGSQQMSADSLMSGSLFSHIHAYLCCAMNHIHEDVRLDSLVLFDALLEAFPHAMVQQTGDLMKNLIGMISSPISIGAKGDTVTQRLSMNPDSKLPIMKFRARVLLRVKLTLQVALLDVTGVDRSVISSGSSNGSVWSLFFDSKCEGTKQNTLLVSQERVQKFSWILKGTASDMQDYIIKPSSLEEFIKMSIPVLLQCWKEARASGPSDTVTGNLLSSDALEVMSLVVGVIELLFSLSATGCARGGNQTLPLSQIIPTSILTESYEVQFTQDFMNHFPYSALIEKKLPKKRKLKGQASTNSAPTQSSLASLNLCVCHIMSYLCSDCSCHKDRLWLGKIQQFVTKSFADSPSVEHTKILIQILMNIFRNPALIEQFTSAFEAACKFYTTCKVKFIQKRELFKLFSFVLNQWDGWKQKSLDHMYCGRYSHSDKMEETIGRFVKNLPRLLLRIPRKEPADIVWVKEVLSCISFSLNGAGLLSVVEKFNECLVDILDPVTGLLNINDEDLQHKVLSLLAQGPALNKNQLKQVLLAIRRPATNPVLPHRKSRSLACQAVTSVSLGIQRLIPFSSQVEFNEMTQAQSDSLSDYLKFMFSILIGMSREELENLSPVDVKTMHKLRSVKFTLEKEQWNRHTDLANTVCQEIVNFQIPASPSNGYHCPFTFISDMEQLWKHALASYGEIHIMSAYSLFKFMHFSSRHHICETPSSELYEAAADVMACVLVNFYLPDKKSEKLNKEIVEQVKVEITACLCTATPLLADVCCKLKTTDPSSDEKQAAVQAIEFLLSNDRLKTRIYNEKMLPDNQT